jgi:hypothetical protein
MISTGNDFQKLPLELKSLYVHAYGTFLMSKEYEEMTIHLYKLDNVYVEVWEDCIEVMHIKTYTTDRCLSKYLNDIDISTVLHG